MQVVHVVRVILVYRCTVKNGVLQYTFGGVLQDTVMPVGVV